MNVISKIAQEIAERRAENEDKFGFQFMYNHIISCNNWDFKNYQLIEKIVNTDIIRYILTITCIKCGIHQEMPYN